LVDLVGHQAGEEAIYYLVMAEADFQDDLAKEERHFVVHGLHCLAD